MTLQTQHTDFRDLRAVLFCEVTHEVSSEKRNSMLGLGALLTVDGDALPVRGVC